LLLSDICDIGVGVVFELLIFIFGPIFHLRNAPKRVGGRAFCSPDPLAGFKGLVPEKGKGREREEGTEGGWTPHFKKMWLRP